LDKVGEPSAIRPLDFQVLKHNSELGKRMDEGDRELPAYIETMLSPRDAQLNQLPVEKLLKIYRRNEVRVFIDRGLAVNRHAKLTHLGG